MTSSSSSSPSTSTGSGEPTSAFVRRAFEGDGEALNVMVGRLTPFLHEQARFRLGALSRPQDLEEVISQTWLQFFLKLRDLEFKGEHVTRRVRAYLSQTLLWLANNFLRREAIRRTAPGAAAEDASRRPDPLEGVPANVTDAIARAMNQEIAGLVSRAFAALSDTDRAVFIFKALEGFDNGVIARMLGVSPNAVAQRYRRALAHLRDRLPPELFEGMDEPGTAA